MTSEKVKPCPNCAADMVDDRSNVSVGVVYCPRCGYEPEWARRCKKKEDDEETQRYLEGIMGVYI